MLAYIYESHGKKNLVPVNMSKSGPKICVNSYYAETEWSVVLQFFISWEFNNPTIRSRH